MNITLAGMQPAIAKVKGKNKEFCAVQFTSIMPREEYAALQQRLDKSWSVNVEIQESG